MPAFEIDIVSWLVGALDDPEERATFGAVQISAGSNGELVTEVSDRLSVRPYVRVPASALARWLTVNWWRLRWEPSRADRDSPSWLRAHSLAAIGSDYAWPALQISSDGERVRLQMRAEPAPDAAGIRYLRSMDVDVAAAEFELAVDQFLSRVEGRVRDVLPDCRDLSELREELDAERSDPALAKASRLQARAGITPGEIDAAWVREALRLATLAGPAAGDEVVAAAPSVRQNLASISDAISAMRASPISVSLPGHSAPFSVSSGEQPWQAAARAARAVRDEFGATEGPISNEQLSDLLSTRFPLPTSSISSSSLTGGFRNGVNNGRTSIIVAKRHPQGQRFYLARLIGAAQLTTSADHILPVTDEGTAFQKFERAFAQEFLCPWNELDAYTDESGTTMQGIEDAAEHFGVSELLVRSTLVNRGKISRDQLELS